MIELTTTKATDSQNKNTNKQIININKHEHMVIIIEMISLGARRGRAAHLRAAPGPPKPYGCWRFAAAGGNMIVSITTTSIILLYYYYY